MSQETVGQQASAGASVKKKLPIILAGIVILVLIGVIFFLLRDRETPAAEPEKAYSGVVSPDNVEKVIAEMEETERTPVGYYEVTMNTEWSFPDGNSVSTNAHVENAESNQNPVYFTVALNDAPEQPIYTSPLLLVGSTLEEIKLDEPLEKGSHACVLTYHLMDEDDNELSTLSVNINISVEN